MNNFKHLLLAFSSDISIVEEAQKTVRVENNNKTLTIQQISSGLLATIKVLSSGGATEEVLSELFIKSDGFHALPKFYFYLEQFINIGFICITFSSDGCPLVTIVPNCPNYSFHFKEVDLETKYSFSRFAYCHKEEKQMILESPLSLAKMILQNWQSAAIITELAEFRNCHELCHKIPGISEKTIQMFLSLLWSAEMISEKEESPNLISWEFHDLIFHARVRAGRHNNSIGRVYSYRFPGIPQLPIVKARVSNDVINLDKPESEKLEPIDYSFTTVLEARQSIRDFGELPITAKQLGEFLYRSVRVKTLIETPIGTLSQRPYPSAGACNELEFYLVINKCENTSPGFYQYYSQEHQLCRISGQNDYTEKLLEDAKSNNPLKADVQVLIIIAACFSRITGYYESIAYAGILKNVGAVFQTMYLVATALGLASCAIGSGNSDLFAVAAGTDYYTETSVGEFLLGSKPEK